MRTDWDKAEFREHFKEIASDYEYNDDIFCKDDMLMRALKLAMQNRLSEEERNVLIAYAESGSYRKVGDMMCCSHQTIKLRIETIRKKLKDALELANTDRCGLNGARTTARARLPRLQGVDMPDGKPRRRAES